MTLMRLTLIRYSVLRRLRDSVPAGGGGTFRVKRSPEYSILNHSKMIHGSLENLSVRPVKERNTDTDSGARPLWSPAASNGDRMVWCALESGQGLIDRVYESLHMYNTVL